MSWLVSSGAGRVRRHAPPRKRRARHQGAAVHPVVQPVAELPRQSRSEAGTVARVRSSASSSALRGDRAAIELTYFANHFDDLISLGPFDPVTFNAQYENIGETRASGIELTGTAIVDGGLRLSGGYTFLDSKVITQHQQQPDLRAGQAAVSAAASLGLAAGVVLAHSRQPGARRRVRRIARRQRFQLPSDHIERRLRVVECERRGSHRAHARGPSSPSTTLPTATTWSRSATRLLAAACAPAFGRGSDGAPEGRHLLERWKGLVRGLPPRTSRLRLRRSHHDVQRGRHAQPIARPAARDPRGAGRAARPHIDHRSAARGTPTTPRSIARWPMRPRWAMTHVVFGDILFDEHREWAERLSAGRGLTAVEPLWKQSTTDLYRELPRVGHPRAHRHCAIEQARGVVSRTRPRRRSARRVRRAGRRSVRRARRVPHRRHRLRGFLAAASRARAGTCHQQRMRRRRSGAR